MKLRDRDMLDAWLEDLSRIGYAPPTLRAGGATPPPARTLHLNYAPSSSHSPVCPSAPSRPDQLPPVASLLVIGLPSRGSPTQTFRRLFAVSRNLYAEVLFCHDSDDSFAPTPYSSIGLPRGVEVHGASCLAAAAAIGFRALRGYAYTDVTLVPAVPLRGELVRTADVKGWRAKSRSRYTECYAIHDLLTLSNYTL